MKNRILSLILLMNSFLVFSQKEVNAKIVIDENSNLKASQYFKQKIKDTLIFAKDILLDSNSARLLNSSSTKYNDYEIQNTDVLNFNVTIPQKANEKSAVTEDYFYVSQKYLGLNKRGLTKAKKFILDIDSKKHKIIFPTNEDLKRKYVTIPVIVGGNFDSIESNEFQIFYLKKQKDSIEKFKRASEGMLKSFNFYKTIFGEQRKPKIVFAPLSGPSATYENLIIYNSNGGQPQTISHEIAHIWFGQDGKIFEKRPVTEAMAEFLSWQYLKQISRFGKEDFDELIKRKFYNIEGSKNFKDLYDKNLDKKENLNLSYDLLPLYFYTRQNSKPDFINQIANFCKYKKDDNTISLDEMNFYFTSKGIQTVFPNTTFPDFFITECTPLKVCITSTSDKNVDVELEIISEDNQKTINIISFSKEKNQQILEIGNSKKITIDPEFKTLQITRLNDIWNKNDDNLLNKNRYKTTKDIERIFAQISEDVLNFLKDTSVQEISKNLVTTESQKQEFVGVKKQFFDTNKNQINGASSIWSSGNKTIFINLSYYNEVVKNSSVLTLKLSLNDDLKTLKRLYIVDENK